MEIHINSAHLPRVFKWCALAALVIVASRAATAQQLVSATFLSVSGSDGKDHDTGVYISVYTAGRAAVLAQVQNADNCGGAQCTYAAGSQHSINLNIVSRPPKASCSNFVFVLGSKANGNDQWEIQRITITLKFSDNSTLQKTVYNVVLNSRGSKIVSVQY